MIIDTEEKVVEDLRRATQDLLKRLTRINKELSGGPRTSTTKVLSRAEWLARMTKRLKTARESTDKLYDDLEKRIAGLKGQLKDGDPTEEEDHSRTPKNSSEIESEEEIAEDAEAAESLEDDIEVAPCSKYNGRVATSMDQIDEVAAVAPSLDNEDVASSDLSEESSTDELQRDWETPIPLRYSCQWADLGEHMVATIMRARSELGTTAVDARGYIILKSDVVLPTPEVQKALFAAQPNEDYVQGFRIEKDELNDCLRATVDTEVAVDLPYLAESDWDKPASLNEEGDFQAWVDNPVNSVKYLIGPPLAADHYINKILHAGPTLQRRSTMPGVNEPYWYLSQDANTPAPLHIEDAGTGSANLLLAGAQKQWLVVFPGSAEQFENQVRQAFGHVKRCSQFVRHLDIVLSPTWLRARQIKFEIVCQRPGEVFCTLPGSTYHAVRNTGRNIAVAINFEYPDAPEHPPAYMWCSKGKGRNKCGEHVIVAEDFRFEDEPKREQEVEVNNDIAEDDGPTPQSTMLHLPNQLAADTQDVESLIEACLAQPINFQWFGCANQQQLRKKLTRFLPGRWISDDLLRSLLEVIGTPFNFYVCESIGLDVASPSPAIAQTILERARSDLRGLIMPFNVKKGHETRLSKTEGRDHWALGVFDRPALRLTTYDIDIATAEQWALVIAECLSMTNMTKVVVETDVQSLPNVDDGGACGLCCCLALDDYLRIHPSSHDRSNLRPYYFRKLLRGYNLSSHYSRLTECSTKTVARSTLPESNTWEHSDRVGKSDPMDLNPAGITEEMLCTLRLALQEGGNCELAADRKLRILQLIMQCSVEDLERLSTLRSACASPIDSLPITSPTDMLTLFEQIKKSSDSFYMPTLIQRFLLIKLYLSFEAQVKLQTDAMIQIRKRRRRQQDSGENIDPLPKCGVTAKNRVLDSIFESGNDQVASRNSRRQIMTFIEFGSKLHFLVSNLTLGLLLALPFHTVYSNSFRLQTLNVDRNCKPIQSSEYHTMSLEEAKFFVRWLPALLHDQLQQWSELNIESLLPMPPLWQRNVEEDSSLLATILPKNKSQLVEERQLVPIRPGKRRKINPS